MLSTNICRHFIPIIFDSSMVIQKIYNLILYDNDISDRKKQELFQKYPCKNASDEADFITEALCFSMSRNFVKRDKKTQQLLTTGTLSPIIYDTVMENEPPKPCKYFCGRDNELKELHELLSSDKKVFLHGIAGIGKSELTKAYAKQYKHEYTNILFISYSGDLVKDITELDFIDDLPEDAEQERFRKHNRFLRSLKEDTLLVIDNFNTTATQESFLSTILKYRCRIIFTTRSRFDNYTTLELKEIADRSVLIDLIGKFYSDAKDHPIILDELVELVHHHTLAIELIARLLENGILEPFSLLKKLETEKSAFDASDKIKITKDGKSYKETYYNHIHTLFSLYQLAEEHKNIMCSLTLIPSTGISARRFASWLDLFDMNSINDLIEVGFITPGIGRTLQLHPMIHEVALVELKPSVSNCKALCKNIRETCLLHGLDVPYYKIMFQTVENIIDMINKDDTDYYLLFIEDVFPYMEKYHYEQGMHLILSELSKFLEQQFLGTNKDRALLLDYKAALEKKTEKAIQYEKEAIRILGDIDSNNAHLAANLYGNLGGLYHSIKNMPLARENLEIGISLLEQYNLIYTNDCIPQVCNYASFLANTGETDTALHALHKTSKIIQEYNSDICSDHAVVQELLGTIYLLNADITNAQLHLKKALSIYEILWEHEPELLEVKKQEITNLHVQAGLTIGRKFFR
ncbi:AAA family ATPase [Mediterraneibacter gnavus]|uniref:AAA family ATPase n=1 Tax=Mediterraneibacter gnavus TaxID=33038 RepID=UPI0035637271